MADWLSTILGLSGGSGKKAEYEVREIKLSDIVESPNQPREFFHEEKIQELSASIKEFGVIQPIVVRKKGSYYELVAGERRLRASRMADIDTIPAIIRKLSNEESLAFSLIENLQREDLNPIEEAKVYLKLVRDLKLSQKEVAEKLGKSPLFITDMIKILRLPHEIKEKLMEGMISKGHGLALLRMKDKKQQLEIMHEVIQHELSVKQAERLISAALRQEKGGGKKVVKKPAGMERINIEHYVSKFEKTVKDLTSDGSKVKFKKIVSKDYLELRVQIPLFQKKAKAASIEKEEIGERRGKINEDDVMDSNGDLHDIEVGQEPAGNGNEAATVEDATAEEGNGTTTS